MAGIWSTRLHGMEQHFCSSSQNIFSSAFRKHRPRPRPFPRYFRASASSNSGSGESNRLLIPGATMATLAMLGLLHARRLYGDRKKEEAREKGEEPVFSPDFKADFLSMVPLRTVSRVWGFITDVELPIWLRPIIYRSWARAFHSNLDEVAQPLEQYATLREFFVRTLKEGSRVVDQDPFCLVSPVDGVILRCGELGMPGAIIEQVKGFSYPAILLLGSNSTIPMSGFEDASVEQQERENVGKATGRTNFVTNAKLNPSPMPRKGLFYCVLYLGPGDYHRVHSPVDWEVQYCRHFPGRLFPVNERATRTIRNLHVENERVVLEGKSSEGYLALVAVGATNVGSIELPFAPELRTNKPKRRLFSKEPPYEWSYQSNSLSLRKGQEVAVFNMGSTVVLVFEAPGPNGYISSKDDSALGSKSLGFRFLVKNGERVRMGQAIGYW